MGSVTSVTGMIGLFALWSGFGLVVFGTAKLCAVPLAILYEIRHLRRLCTDRPLGRYDRANAKPLVSVVVPGYNEAPVLANCVHSILASDYEHLEVVIVDDGSTDDTGAIADRLATDARVTAIHQPNAGKGTALNRGIAQSRGEILMFVDADGIFAPNTVTEMLRAFTDPTVGAVCGDDRPANLDRVQTRLLALLSHAGTGLVRRALHQIGCLPIVSGNIGAYPREVLDLVGDFNTDTVGEDLELTWRVQRAGYRVAFAPRALVYAEAPSTIPTLWRQRVRWARGLLQTMRIHRRMIGNPAYGAFGVYLFVNTITMIVAPVLQLFLLVFLPLAALGWAGFALPAASPQASSATPAFSPALRPLVDAAAVLGWFGLIVSLTVVVVATLLNRSARDLRHVWTLPLWPLYSAGMAAAMVAAIYQQARGRRARWNKMTRTGVVSAAPARDAVANAARTDARHNAPGGHER